MSKAKSNEFVVDFDSGSHTLPNLLRTYAWREKNVVFSGYTRGHLLVGKTRFVLKVNEQADAKKILHDVIKKVKSDLSSLKKAIK